MQQGSDPQDPKGMDKDLETSAGEELIHGFPHRLFDGYDGGVSSPTSEVIDELLRQAPTEVRSRIEEFARQKTATGS